MDYQQFISEVKKGVQQCVKEDVSIYIHTAVKNNGKERYGLTVIEKGINISPTIYLEEYFDHFKKGKPIEEIISKVVTLYQEVRFPHCWYAEHIKIYACIKEVITFKVVNLEANQEMLGEMPYIPFLDLAVVFSLMFELNDSGSATMAVKSEHLQMWGVTVKELFQEASKNTSRLLPPEFKEMQSVINGLLGTGKALKKEVEEAGEDMMYVLSNHTRTFGAACILYDGLLERIGNHLQENFYILPSSVHEVIIIPESRSLDKPALESMVREVNETQVNEEEVLSDRPYYFSRKERRLFL